MSRFVRLLFSSLALTLFTVQADPGLTPLAEAEGFFKRGFVAQQQQRDAKARQYYEKAAAAGHPGAQFQLAQLYREGWGGVRDAVQARRWLERAAAAGHPLARAALQDWERPPLTPPDFNAQPKLDPAPSPVPTHPRNETPARLEKAAGPSESPESQDPAEEALRSQPPTPSPHPPAFYRRPEGEALRPRS